MVTLFRFELLPGLYANIFTDLNLIKISEEMYFRRLLVGLIFCFKDCLNVPLCHCIVRMICQLARICSLSIIEFFLIAVC